jgi:hypothetical protein
MGKIIRFILILVILIVAGFLGFRFYTKLFSPPATATFEDKGLKITVEYCRPKKKNRVIFGGLVPYGKVWRTGANEATEITFSRDVIFGDKPIAAGTYTLFTIPEKDKWTVILNSVLGQWGHFSYNPAKDVLQTEAKPILTENETEEFMIQLVKSGKGADMELLWDKTKVTVPIQEK